MVKIKKLILPLAAGLLLVASFIVFSFVDFPLSNATSSDDKEPVSVDDKEYINISGLKFYKSLDDGLLESNLTGKPIFVYVWASWCGYCKKFDLEVLPDPGVNEILKKDFVLVMVDIDVQTNLVKKFGVYATPTLIFLDPDGEEIKRFPGFVYADDFLVILEEVRSNQS